MSATDLRGDSRAAGRYSAPGGRPTQKDDEPETRTHPAGVQELPVQCGTLPGPGTRVPSGDRPSLLRSPQYYPCPGPWGSKHSGPEQPQGQLKGSLAELRNPILPFCLQPQDGLIDEVHQLEATISALKQKLAQTQ